MSDPKNIPLSEAKIGDIVHLKPQRVGYLPPAKNYLATDQLLLVKPGMIDHIERAPRPLEVGGRVVYGRGFRGQIRAIDGEWAWVRFPHSFASVLLEELTLTDLERVDG